MLQICSEENDKEKESKNEPKIEEMNENSKVKLDENVMENENILKAIE